MTSTDDEMTTEADTLDLHSLRGKRTMLVRRSFNYSDAFEGVASKPLTLHKYGYANNDPIDNTDPSGNFSLAMGLTVGGISAIGISMLLPAIHGAYKQAYSITAQGQTQNLISATLGGNATLGDWKRTFQGFGSGLGAGAINALDTLSFRQINQLSEYRDQLWHVQGLDESWIGATANGFAWAGTAALYTGVLVYGLSAAGAETMSVSVRFTGQAPKFLHFEYAANGVWRQALGAVGSMWTIGGSGAGLQITGIPVVSAAAVLRDPSTAYNCFTAVVRAAFRGMGGW